MDEKATKNDMTRLSVFRKIFDSYIYGNLGMFIGAGFSKSVMEDETQQALNWFELIEKASERLEIDFPEDKELIGISLPEVSTNICKKLAKMKDINYDEAKLLFKNKICELSNWLPSGKRIKVFRDIFDVMDPSWIITTNYDLVLETILTGKSKSLNPSNYLSSPRGTIPIYHIHGTRLDPDSIIITQDDYIPLFRPNEYRQTKLAMTIRESTTLVLGYGLGDMNVLSALDWSKNIYTEKNEYPSEIIQVIWTSSPKEDPYIDENDNIIIEIDNLEAFLKELVEILLYEGELYNNELKILDNIIGKLDQDDDQLVKKFIDEKEFRIRLIEILSRDEYNMMYSYISFFIRCMDKIWREASSTGNLYAYDKYLIIILDIIINYEYNKMPPSLFRITAKSLNKVLAHVGTINKLKPIYDENSEATRTWHDRKASIPKQMVKELFSYAEMNSLSHVEEFMKDLID